MTLGATSTRGLDRNQGQLCLDERLSGNDVPDAWLAAAAVHVGEHLVSFDRAFARLSVHGRAARRVRLLIQQPFGTACRLDRALLVLTGEGAHEREPGDS